MRIRHSISAVLTTTFIALLTTATAAAAAPVAPSFDGDDLRRVEGGARAAAASLPGYDEIVRDGVTLLHRREPVAATPRTGTGVTRSDLDGDGLDDIAAFADTGVVVRYSSAAHRDYLITEIPGGTGCVCFGTEIVAGNFDGDRYDDLAVADMDEVDLKALGYHAGAVWIFPGGPGGLQVDRVQHVNLSSAGVPGASADGDWFGAALSSGDITGDGRDELAIGIPGKQIGSARGAGAVVVLKGSATGIVTTGAQWTSQNSGGVPGSAETNDAFGSAVAIGKVNKDKHAELIVGAFTENEGDLNNGSGTVVQFWGAAGGFATSKVTSVSGEAATAAFNREGTYLWMFGMSLGVTDTNRDGYGEVVVGVPGAQVGSGWDLQPGAVVTLKGNATGLTAKGLRVASQDTLGVGDSTENEDWFGDSVSVGDVTNDGYGDILVGVPGEDVGKVADAGAVVLLKGSKDGMVGAGSQTIGQNTAGAPDGAESGDRFGAAVSLLNLNGVGGFDAVIGTPEETRDTADRDFTVGSVTTFGGGPGGFSTGYVKYGTDVGHEGLLVSRYGFFVNGL
ncbi:FG-GAP repeat protein [Spirilliplanes yamanashiensis]|nr:FG-GAP repeat protein [Spirilliplanes yamanashiensis]MDP9815043.1 hypothetical protein [Spirilliplanes yamanashiensis]